MTVEAQKKNHQNQHHHHKHHHHHTHKKLVNLKSIERITNLPVVESAHAYYEKIKNSNTLIKWSLIPAETGVWLAVGTAMPVISYFETPVTAIDTIVCHGLDVIEANLPMIKYPPDLVYNITKDYVTSKVVTPMLKRADSVKQLSLNGANNFGEIAADRLNNAIDVADKYVEKYLPDISDATDSSTSESSSVMVSPNSKKAKTIQHVNQFGRKLQRRLTRRTIAEAKALKQQGADTIRCLVYLVDLLARDPQMFMEKARLMWMELSKDEPENQVPPANLEQLIAMLTREMARRLVHVTNYTGAKVVLLSHYGVHAAHVSALNLIWWADYLIKKMHLENAVEKTAAQVTRIHHVSVELVERLVELIRNLKIESMKASETAAPQGQSAPQPLPAPQPQQQPVTPQSVPRTSSVSSTASTTSFSSSSSSTGTIGNKVPPSQNGDTHTVQNNHEAVVS